MGQYQSPDRHLLEISLEESTPTAMLLEGPRLNRNPFSLTPEQALEKGAQPSPCALTHRVTISSGWPLKFSMFSSMRG
jgi:hypothetical protein